MNAGSVTRFIQSDISGRSLRFQEIYGWPDKEEGIYFSGIRWEAGTELYLLGNGHRAYCPLVRKFMQPDPLSPFGEGGLNSHAYCLNDPINMQDPSGSMPRLLKLIGVVGKSGNRGVRQLLESVNRTLISTMPAPSLVNSMSNRLARELSLYQSSPKVFGKIARSADPGFMSRLHMKRDYKFIMDGGGEIIASPWIKERHVPSHAVLADFTPVDRVIAAGHIRKNKGLIELTNRSGHYMPPVESLAVPALYFSSRGYRVDLGRLM